MKNFLLSLIFICGYILIADISFAQTVPQEMNYQGVARDAGGNILANQSIGLQIDLRQTTSTGTVVYGESHAVSTNQFGLFNIMIGSGSVVLGTISAIDWSNGPYYLEVGMDATGGTAYVSMGVSQLLSVPYALYAETSGSGGPTGPQGPAGADGAQGPTGPMVTGIESQTLRHNGSDWEASSNIWNTGSNVGIGMNTPSTRLQVDGNIKVGYSDSYLLGAHDALWYSPSPPVGNVIGTSNATHNLTVHVGGSIQHIFSSEGNVGIRTTTPSAVLEVVGDTLVTGMFSSDYTGGFLQQPKVLYGEYNGESVSGAAVYGKSVLANDGDGIGSVGEGGYIGVQGILDAGTSIEDCYAGYFGPSQMFGPLVRAGGGGSTYRWGVYAEADGGNNNIGVQGVATDGGGNANYGVQATAADATENYAVQAIAENGLGNFGLWASASGGLGNYAGYFDQGTVFVRDNVGIGTTNPEGQLVVGQSGGLASDSQGIFLENDGDSWKTYHSGLHFSFSNEGVRYAYVEDNTGNYVITSDKTLKTSIEKLSSVLDGVTRLNPVTYSYKSSSDASIRTYGFLAQEVGEVFPELVRYTEDGTPGLAYDLFSIVSIKALQEQQELIESQQAQISALESKVDELDMLKAEIEKIKSALGTK